MAKLLYQGHGSFRIVTGAGTVIYIDPYAGEGYDLPADIILVTHQHYDHNRTDLPPHAEGCRVYQSSDAQPLPGDYRREVIKGLPVEATEAYNDHHPKDECVGYIIEADGRKCYFAGDTSMTAEMRELGSRGLDWAFLPCDGIYNMDIPEAVECARMIKAGHTVPCHMAPGKLFDVKRAGRFDLPGVFRMAPGEETEL